MAGLAGVDLTAVDSTPGFSQGTITKFGDKQYIYLKVASAALATQEAKAACSNGRPAMYDVQNKEAKCYSPTVDEGLHRNSKMVIGLVTAAIGKYCWFLSEGVHDGARHDKNQAADGMRFVFASATATINQLANFLITNWTGVTARVQGYIFTNSATNKSNTGDNKLKVMLFGF